MLNCRPVGAGGMVLEEGHTEGLGYSYADVTSQPVAQGASLFEYAAENTDTNLKVMDDAALSLTFDFRDWKYMSQIERFVEDVTDPDVIAGLTNGSI